MPNQTTEKAWPLPWHSLVFVFLFTGLLSGFSQQVHLQGLVKDSLGNELLPGVIVSVVNKADSKVEAIGITNDKGLFDLPVKIQQDYKISFQLFSFRTKWRTIHISDTNLLLNPTFLISNALQLDGIEIVAEAPPISMRNDTLEFNASSFKVSENANLELLLKKLPGVKVEKDGSITVNGKKVTTITIEGKSFFGGGTGVALKNIDAQAVDKVQVMDKKSVNTEDENTENNSQINITLKEEYKKGWFGKLNAGSGYKDIYNGSTNLNCYNKNHQFSMLAKGNNLNNPGYNYDELNDFFGGNFSLGYNEESNSMNIHPMLGDYNKDDGLTSALNGGLNYGYSNKKIEHLTISAFGAQQSRKISSLSQRVNWLGDSTFSTGKNNQTNADIANYFTDVSLSVLPDSTSHLNFQGNFKWNNTLSQSVSYLENKGANSGLYSSGEYQNKGSSALAHYEARLEYNKQLTKKGRQFYIKVESNRDDENGILHQRNFTTFLQNNFQDFDYSQQTLQENNQSEHTVLATFTEPLDSFWKIKTQLTWENTGTHTSRQNTGNDSLGGPVNLYNADFSTGSETRWTKWTPQAGVNWRKKKYHFSVNGFYQSATLDLQSQQSSAFNKTLESYGVKSRMGIQKNNFSIYLNYQTKIQNPRVQQLIPGKNQTGDLNIESGNSQLRNALKHQVNIFWNAFSLGSKNYIHLSTGVDVTQHPFIRNDSLASNGIRYSYTINGRQNNGYNFSVYGGYELPKDIVLDMSLSYNRSDNESYLNGQSIRRVTHQFNSNPEIGLEKDHFGFTLGGGMSYSILQNNNQSGQSSNLNFNPNLDLFWNMGDKWEWELESYLNSNNGLSENINAGYMVINSQIRYYCFKNKSLLIGLKIFDALNQNKSVYRENGLNYYEDIQTNSIGRYIEFSATLKFKKGNVKSTREEWDEEEAEEKAEEKREKEEAKKKEEEEKKKEEEKKTEAPKEKTENTPEAPKQQ